MAVIATNTLEPRNSALGEHRQVLVNLELNHSCPHTNICGQTCYINAVAPVGKAPLSPEQVLIAAREVLESGETVRHLVLPGMEVFESAELLLRIVEEFHGASIDTRPGDISIITASSAGLKRYASRLADTPLSVVNISMDTAESGLRSPRSNGPLLDAALDLKRGGGTALVGVNTVLTDLNLAAAIEIGRQVQGAGVDQWSLGPLLRRQDGRMESVLSAAQLRRIIDRVSEEFAGSGLEIVFDLDLPLMRGLVDVPGMLAASAERWRYEYEWPGAPNILLEAGNSRPGYFVRLDWTGQLMSKEDYRWVSRPGSYGQYAPGRISGLIEQFRELRAEPALTT